MQRRRPASEMRSLAILGEMREINDGPWEKIREKTHQADPTNPTGTIRHDRQSVVWLVEPAWKAIVTLLWVAPDTVVSPSLSLLRSFSFSLSLFRPRLPPITKQRARRRERAKEKIDEEREDKRRDRDAYNYLSFYVREPGRLSRPVVLFLASAFTRLSSRHSLLFFLSLASPLILFLTRAVSLFSFSFFFIFLRSALFSWLESAMRPRMSARVTNATDGRTDGHARMHTGKPKRSAREWTRELSDPTRLRDLLVQRAALFPPWFLSFPLALFHSQFYLYASNFAFAFFVNVKYKI